MKYDIKILASLANELGFVIDTLEKVIRLTEILTFINTENFLKGKLALKGKTAINLFYGNFYRLSVDIDLDYAVNEEREIMMQNRAQVKEIMGNYFISEGYVLNKKSRFSHSLDGFVVSYEPSGG